jgi:hypothetical protein
MAVPLRTLPEYCRQDCCQKSRQRGHRNVLVRTGKKRHVRADENQQKSGPEIAAVRTGRFDLLRKIRLPIRQASAAQALPQIACCGCDKIPVRTSEAASALKQAVENSMARTALRMSFHGSCFFG